MDKYESVIIVKSNLSKKQLEETTCKVEKKIEKFANITQKKDYGTMKLAYEIRGNDEGHYISYQFELKKDNNGDSIMELERLYRILDEIIKYIVVKL